MHNISIDISSYKDISGYPTIYSSKDIRRYMTNEVVKKFLQSIDDAIYTRLDKQAAKKGITVQELIRAVIVPNWLEKNS